MLLASRILFQTVRQHVRYMDLQSSMLKTVPAALLHKAKTYQSQLDDMNKQLSQGLVLDPIKQRDRNKYITITDLVRDYEQIDKQINELKVLKQSDPQLADDADEEIKQLTPSLEHYSERLWMELLPIDQVADKAALIELRPGVGGIEAMNFTQNLFQMYINYCKLNDWSCKVISKQDNESGSGLVSGILSVDKAGSFDTLRFESGIHRVQRIPDTERQGRVHTSTAAVVVLPQEVDPPGGNSAHDKCEREFKPGEVRVDVKRASGKGGQHVNTTDSAIRLTHIPTGIVVSMQDERSQHRNKEKAFMVLRARIAQRELEETQARERKLRTDQVSSTDRSDKIRTYNYSQNRVTDHRVNLTVHGVDSVLSGDNLHEFADALKERELTAKITHLLQSTD